jgi:membrane protein implicated in regulation of membrane protease activity
MDWLFSLYIIATFFGIGVTLFDLVGLLGHHTDQADGSHDGHDSHITEQGDSSTLPHEDTSMSHHGEDHHGEDTHHLPAHDNTAPSHQAGSWASHDNPTIKITPFLRLLSYLRTLVYFSVGFGPIGWIALVTGRGILNSLFWSIPGGLLFAIGGRLIRRLQRQELDSSIKEDELLMEYGEVIVTINPGKLGKIRINYSGQYLERYAKGRDPLTHYPLGTKVRITEVTEEFLIVTEE